ncbi:MAG: type II toxin-antitoxin system Phd/YefM family antitoxin [Solirubrobacteraceae bacterium]
MTKSVGVHEAKTHLSRLLDEVLAGHEVVITRRGEQVARLVAVRTARKAPVFGLDEGKLQIPDDFDAPLPPEIQQYFE